MLDGLTANPGINPVGICKWIGDRKLVGRHLPSLLHLQQTVLVGDALLFLNPAIAHFPDQAQIIERTLIVGLNFGRPLQDGFRLIELAHFKQELAVLNHCRGLDKIGAVFRNGQNHLLAGQFAYQISEALIIVRLEVLGDYVGRINFDRSVNLGVRLPYVPIPLSLDCQCQANGTQALARHLPLFGNRASQLFTKGIGIFVESGCARVVLGLCSSFSRLKRLAEQDRLFLPADRFLFSDFIRGLPDGRIGRGHNQGKA